jgi:tetratricopeptide (TPR) repeat protein
MKTVPAAAQSEIFFHAARFFGDVFGDTDGAVTYLERVLALAPGHEGAFARLENILSAKDDRLRLRDLYASAAAHRSDVGEQVRLLRCALVLTGESDAERTIVLLEQIYKTDPTAEGIRDTLAQRLALAGRHGEAAKLIEQTLAAAAGEPPEATSRMRRRLVDLYAAKMHEAERAISHVEELLRADPEDALAKKCAEELLSHKVLGVRAAGALEGVYLHEARWIDAAGMMKLQAEQLRGPKRLEAQKRLAALTFERLGDLAKALSLYEAIVLADPADDDARDHFRKLSAALDKFGDAARILARVATAVREPKVKGRILAELGDVYAAQGDDKRARSTLFAALETGEDGDAMLGAAITLTNLLSVARDFRGLVVVLARLAELEPSATARLAAAERLAKVWEADLGDPKAAALAWRKLLGTKREATALAALERLYELTEDHPALAEILEKRAENEKSPAERRRLLLAAADRRALSPEGRGAALAAYANLATAYGASRELVERALPLLEQERRYAEVGGWRWKSSRGSCPRRKRRAFSRAWRRWSSPVCGNRSAPSRPTNRPSPSTRRSARAGSPSRSCSRRRALRSPWRSAWRRRTCSSRCTEKRRPTRPSRGSWRCAERSPSRWRRASRPWPKRRRCRPTQGTANGRWSWRARACAARRPSAWKTCARGSRGWTLCPRWTRRSAARASRRPWRASR